MIEYSQYTADWRTEVNSQPLTGWYSFPLLGFTGWYSLHLSGLTGGYSLSLLGFTGWYGLPISGLTGWANILGLEGWYNFPLSGNMIFSWILVILCIHESLCCLFTCIPLYFWIALYCYNRLYPFIPQLSLSIPLFSQYSSIFSVFLYFLSIPLFSQYPSIFSLFIYFLEPL